MKDQVAKLHNDAADEYEKAAKQHRKAAEHHKEGHHEKAAHHAHAAHGHNVEADHLAAQAAKHHSTNHSTKE